MTTFLKYTLIGAGILFIAGIILVLGGIPARAPEPENQEELAGGQAISACATDLGSNATTSIPTFLTSASSATTTFFGDTNDRCFTANADLVDVNFIFQASTSVSQLFLAVLFSDNGIDWYTETNKTVVSNTLTTHGATTTHAFAGGSQHGNITITPVASRYIRLDAWVGGANGSFWAQVIKREQN